ncbi:MAG: bacillithiol biosynthesis deacetylase BshB1 [Bacteroidota bacterium]
MTETEQPTNHYKSILAIAAHPDDVELSCAGVLMMEKRNGKRASIVDLTRGELGTRGTEETRKQEAQDALLVMGLDARENLGLPDGFFQNDQASQMAVIKAIRKYRPEIILANAIEDRHPDHGRAASLIKDASFLSGLRKIQTTNDGIAQEPWRSTYVFHFIQDRYMQPSIVFDITPVMDQKIAAIKAFRTQFNTGQDNEPQTYISSPEFLQGIIDRARMFGKMIGVPYAEGFVSEKLIGINSFDNIIKNIT